MSYSIILFIIPASLYQIGEYIRGVYVVICAIFVSEKPYKALLDIAFDKLSFTVPGE